MQKYGTADDQIVTGATGDSAIAKVAKKGEWNEEDEAALVEENTEADR